MAFRDSPGVTFREIDRSRFVQPGTGLVIGMIIDSNEGPVGLTASDHGIEEIHSVDEYLDVGFPTPQTTLERSAVTVLRASPRMDDNVRLKVKRALSRDQNDDIDTLWAGAEVGDQDTNGTDEISALSTGIVYPWEDYSFPNSDVKFTVFANNPGAHGDNIGIGVDSTVGTSDEFVLEVYTREDSSATFELQEEHFVAQTQKKDDKNRQMFIEDRVKQDSDLIIAINNPDNNGDINEDTLASTALGGGDDGSGVEASDLVTAADSFRDIDRVDVLITGGEVSTNGTLFAEELATIASEKQQTFAVIDAPYDVDADTITDTFLSNLTLPGGLDNSYSGVWANWQQDFEHLRQAEVENPPSAYVAHRMATFFDGNEQWQQVAGIEHGAVPSRGLVRQPWNRADRDQLYRNHVNYFRQKDGIGVYMEGYKNLYNVPFGTKMDRVHVRFLLNYIKRNLEGRLESFKHKLNTEELRRQVRVELNAFLDDIQGREGLNDHEVICDESNNPQSVIDQNELHIDILLDPTMAAEFILANIHVVETGEVDFNVQFIQ